MICPNCKNENKNSNIKCEFCSMQLIDVNEFKVQENFIKYDTIETKQIHVSPEKMRIIINILLMFFLGPWLLVGTIFFGFGIYNFISERNQTDGYEKTTGTLIDIVGNEAKYEYIVDGSSYLVSPSMLGDANNFKEKETVYYNPTKPNESIIYSDYGLMTVMGFIVAVVQIIIIIFVNIAIKKSSKNKENAPITI